jgi:hypothetical protein
VRVTALLEMATGLAPLVREDLDAVVPGRELTRLELLDHSPLSLALKLAVVIMLRAVTKGLGFLLELWEAL